MDSKALIDFLNECKDACNDCAEELTEVIAAIRERDKLRDRIERAFELAEKVGPYAKQVMWPVLKGEDK